MHQGKFSVSATPDRFEASDALLAVNLGYQNSYKLYHVNAITAFASDFALLV